MIDRVALIRLNNSLSAPLFIDKPHHQIDATDDLIFQNPVVIIYPKELNDIVKSINFARNNAIDYILGTGNNFHKASYDRAVVLIDFTPYYNRILSFDENEKTVQVQPGITEKQLNQFLYPLNLKFNWPDNKDVNRSLSYLEKNTETMREKVEIKKYTNPNFVTSLILKLEDLDSKNEVKTRKDAQGEK